jgi:hypothetical protein
MEETKEVKGTIPAQGILSLQQILLDKSLENHSRAWKEREGENSDILPETIYLGIMTMDMIGTRRTRKSTQRLRELSRKWSSLFV